MCSVSGGGYTVGGTCRHILLSFVWAREGRGLGEARRGGGKGLGEVRGGGGGMGEAYCMGEGGGEARGGVGEGGRSMGIQVCKLH